MQYGVDQYYVILSHLSTYFNNSIIVDLGTLTGGSAQALAYNQSNTVYTYDILEDGTAIQRFARVECENIKYIIGDCIRDNWAGMVMLDGVPPMNDKKIFLSSELIFLDVDPHDGVQEQVVLRFLVENDWKGILVCDDIGAPLVEQPLHLDMRNWWDSIDLLKHDIINRYSSPTGTGIICFDNQRISYSSPSKEEIAYQKNQSRLDPARWIYSEAKTITRFDDGTFETNDGITGTWNTLRKLTGEEAIVIKTQAGSVEIPITKT